MKTDLRALCISFEDLSRAAPPDKDPDDEDSHELEDNDDQEDYEEDDEDPDEA